MIIANKNTYFVVSNTHIITKSNFKLLWHNYLDLILLYSNTRYVQSDPILINFRDNDRTVKINRVNL